jgi:hypothetical protein
MQSDTEGIGVDTVGQILAEHVSNHGNNNGHACDCMLYDMRGSCGPYNHVPDLQALERMGNLNLHLTILTPSQ